MWVSYPTPAPHTCCSASIGLSGVNSEMPLESCAHLLHRSNESIAPCGSASSVGLVYVNVLLLQNVVIWVSFENVRRVWTGSQLFYQRASRRQRYLHHQTAQNSHQCYRTMCDGAPCRIAKHKSRLHRRPDVVQRAQGKNLAHAAFFFWVGALGSPRFAMYSAYDVSIFSKATCFALGQSRGSCSQSGLLSCV